MQSAFEILIVEDEMLIAQHIASLLGQAGYVKTTVAQSVEEALLVIHQRKPHLVFTDIGLEGEQTGIDLGRLLHEEYKIPFIYVTSHTSSDIVSKAKYTRPNAYLVKPFKKEDLLISLELSLMDTPAPSSEDERYLVIKDGHGMARIAYDEILLLKAEKNYTIIQTINRNQRLVRYVLAEVLEMLPHNQFVRIHKSYAVNARLVTQVNALQLKMGTLTLPVGRAHKEGLRRFFAEFS